MIKKAIRKRVAFFIIIKFRDYPRKNFIIPCRTARTGLLLQRMKTIAKPGSRQRLFCQNDLFQRRSALRGAGSVLSLLLSFCLCILPALLGSCRRVEAPEIPGEEEPVPVIDSVLLDIRLDAGGRIVRRADLFIYDTGGIRALETHLALDSLPARLQVPATPGEKRVVCIANSPYAFNLNTLARCDAIEQLSYAFTDDDPDRPLLSAAGTTEACAVTLLPRPMLCRVRLAAVSNTLDGYELLEEPCVRLCDLPHSAEILRESDFRPSELIDTGPWTALPCDVGFFTQEPDIDLWCYPNDTPEEVLGVPRPTLEFRCKIRGETCSFEVPLPPLARGGAVEAELTIDGPGSFRYRVQ